MSVFFLFSLITSFSRSGTMPCTGLTTLITPSTIHRKKVKVKVKSLSRVWLFVTPWTVARQAPLSMGFSRQEYWSGLSFPPPEDLPNPGIKLMPPALGGGSLLMSHLGSPRHPIGVYWEVREILWCRKWQPTPVFLPGESHGQRSLMGYSSWGHKETDTTEQLSTHTQEATVYGSQVCISCVAFGEWISNTEVKSKFHVCLSKEDFF